MSKDQKTLSPLPATLFQDIALAFSGGGFRASSFALGTLSLFEKIKIGDANEKDPEKTLLKKVRYLSSASGGTIATALYTLYSANGKDFGVFYKKLFIETEGDNLLKRALEILTTKSHWSSSTKNRNLINAFALAYDELLFSSEELKLKSATVGDLKKPKPITHLKEVCFNTTEFYHGLLFRQTVNLETPLGSADSGLLYGNYMMFLGHKASEGIRLADILAASSCFPGGFEPIIFPDDFAHEGCTEDSLFKSLRIILENGETEKPSVGLMDGGITDNLGVESMMQADMRKADPNRFDFMVTNDVGSHYMPPFEVFKPSKSWIGKLTIFVWILIALIITGLGVYLLVRAFNATGSSESTCCAVLGTILAFAPGVMLCAILLFYLGVQGFLGKDSGLNLRQKFGGRITNLFFKEMLHTPINTLIWMVKARISSASTLVSDLFLKRVRQLLDNEFYESLDWAGRAKGSRIYDLSFTNDIYRKSYGFPDLEPSPKMQRIAEISYRMSTTLWFDRQRNAEQSAHACLVACGQFTACYNLLDYINRVKECVGYEDLPELYRNRANDIETQLSRLYAILKENPFSLYNELGKQYIDSNFNEMKVENVPDIETFLIRNAGAPPS